MTRKTVMKAERAWFHDCKTYSLDSIKLKCLWEWLNDIADFELIIWAKVRLFAQTFLSYFQCFGG